MGVSVWGSGMCGCVCVCVWGGFVMCGFCDVWVCVCVGVLVIVLFYVLFVCKCVLYCTVLLPPGVNPTAVTKYISYQ